MTGDGYRALMTLGKLRSIRALFGENMYFSTQTDCDEYRKIQLQFFKKPKSRDD